MGKNQKQELAPCNDHGPLISAPWPIGCSQPEMNDDLKDDSIIQLRTREGTYRGKLLSKSPKRITLGKVVVLPSRKEIPGLQTFLKSDILLLTECNAKDDQEPDAVRQSSNAITSNDDVDWMIITDCDDVYISAIDYLSKQDEIGISLEGHIRCRSDKAQLFAVATSDHLFLFDIGILGIDAFLNGLKGILENVGIIKVLHDSRQASDYLLHSYGVTMKNVFDTQVADLYLRCRWAGHSLSSVCRLETCISDYLLKEYREAVQINADGWEQRPLQSVIIDQAVTKSRYLLDLKQYLLNALLEPLLKVSAQALGSSMEQDTVHSV